MSWSELERLVDDAETDGGLRRCLRHCRSRSELLLASRRLGYGIHPEDLRQAWLLERDSGAEITRGDRGNHPLAHRATG